ncbi:MAG: ribonuclease III [Magnetococcales bacterium]|nr:ribonuclease III [Magnetococcales bacterium]
MESPGKDWDEACHGLESRLAYLFADRRLLQTALTHRSWDRIKGEVPFMAGPHNERLEFLGDAVLNLVISEQLFQRLPAADEGVLSHWRAQLVNTTALAEMARSLGLGELLRLGRGEARSGGGEKPTLLADALEAVLGAMLLDGGLDAARTFILRQFDEGLAGAQPEHLRKDFKSLLQELLQAESRPLPHYQVVTLSGAPHERHFTVECRVEGVPPALGEGRSRRAAEHEAARLVFLSLDGPPPPARQEPNV